MASLESVILGVRDPAAAEAFYAAAFGLGDKVRVRLSAEPTTGFRGFTLSLVVSQPSTVDSLIGTALSAGAAALKPAAKSFWGYGGVVRAPDSAIWNVATSNKKDSGGKYVEFKTPASPIRLALYGRGALAKDAGVCPDGTGSHRIAIGSDAGPFTDPDAFAWEAE